jgi:pyridinium-3,5-biscarboxylic acid mononucleotide sulfurtransferase
VGGASQPAVARELVVGFDLDMTLIDSRPGVEATWHAFSRETGVYVDAGLAAGRLGPPLADEMRQWVQPDRVDELVQVYRGLYAAHALDAIHPMPGVAAALAAVRALGGRTVLVTAKLEAHARSHVDRLGLDIDEVVGDRWGHDKGRALADHGATVYVGDHVHDIAGARAADAVAVAVATGPCSADELAAAGADVVLEDLTEFPGWLAEYVLQQRLDALTRRLHELGSVVVAFSGGADSAFLLAAAVGSLGADRVVAATGLSESLPDAELAPAEAFCRDLGVRLVRPRTHEMERAGYRANSGRRCYFCKAELVETLTEVARSHGIATVATGTNADDAVAGFRPGIQAAAERGAATPLLDAGLTKAQVREASRRWGLPTADKPAAACLSSRIAYGIEVSPARLARVERAEVAVRATLAAAGHRPCDLRVRDLGDAARVELDKDLVDLLDGAPLADVVVADVVAAGFQQAEIDPRGFRSGSMNDALRAGAAHSVR